MRLEIKLFLDWYINVGIRSPVVSGCKRGEQSIVHVFFYRLKCLSPTYLVLVGVFVRQCKTAYELHTYAYELHTQQRKRRFL